MHSKKQNFFHILSSPLVIGTIFLTGAGILSRMIGFFYRIFLSRTIGAESLGLYQLVFPVLTLLFAVCSSGIQTSISKHVAGAVGSAAENPSGRKNARRYLAAGLLYSLILSVLFSGILYFFSDWIALHLLGESRCAKLLVIMSFSLLPASIHSCINGYYYGLKKASVPSGSQLAEQLARVLGVYLIYKILDQNGQNITEVHAVWGLVIGEVCGLLYSLTALGLERRQKNPAADHTKLLSTPKVLREIGIMAIPLTANQALVHLCSSIENMLIPQRLQAYGYTSGEALAVYGVLSGMAISIIFFPGVLTNSISVLLLPSISEAHARGQAPLIRKAVSRAIFYGLALGGVFTVVFFFSGNFIGNVIFSNALAGELIRRLGWLCPMMYVYSLLSSVLHGLGKAKYVLFINLLASGIRIGIILTLVPAYGLSAVLWGMLLSQLFAAIAAIILVTRWNRE